MKPSDLDVFFKAYSPSQIGSRPTLVSIDGGSYNSGNSSDLNDLVEGDLDVQTVMGLLGKTQEVTLYQNGDVTGIESFNNFLDAIDGSFCTYEGGDDPTQDGIYPDPYGGYQGASV